MWLLLLLLKLRVLHHALGALGRLRSRTFIGRFLAVADSDVINTRADALYYTTAAQNVIFFSLSLFPARPCCITYFLFIPGGLQHKTKCAVVCNWSADKNPNKNLIRINVYKRFSFCLSTSSSSFFSFLIIYQNDLKKKKREKWFSCWPRGNSSSSFSGAGLGSVERAGLLVIVV